MKNISVLCVLALMIIVSCSKAENRENQSYTFSVKGLLEELPVEQETKVSLAHTMKMTWSIGDAVSVVNMTKGLALGGSLTADVAETRSTFSGVVTGTIDNGDLLALIYPSLGYTQQQPFSNAEVDFSAQDGTDKNAKFCAVATITANTSNGVFVNADTRFYMKSGIINITLADLPSSTVINQVRIPALYSSALLSINSAKDDIVLSGIDGTITLSPNSATGSQGTKGLYFGLAGAAKSSSRRAVSVLCGQDLYESTMTASAIGTKFYTLSIGAFTKKAEVYGIGFNYDNTEMEEGDTVHIGVAD